MEEAFEGDWDGDFISGISALVKETPERSLILLPYDDSVIRQPSMNQEVGCLVKTQNLLVS